MDRLISVFGLFILITIAFALSESKKDIKWKTILSGVVLQILFGVFVLKTQAGLVFFDWVNQVFSGLLSFTNSGSSFVFGGLADYKKMGFVIATMVLPSIIFMSSLMSVLYHIGIMQIVIRGVAWVMMRVMGTSGAESLAAAANIFTGQTEAPLVVKPYINKMTKSEIMALMTGGMATVAGGVFAAYVGMGIDAGHLLAASVMSAPAALVCAKLMVPETEVPLTQGDVKVALEKKSVNIIDAAAIGAHDGLMLALNVAAMLLAFLALIAMVNGLLGWVGGLFNMENALTLELIFSYLFAPVAFILGIPWQDCHAVGALLGKKIIINEFVAYQGLQEHMANATISKRSIIISTYALCGFANIASVAIQVGGIGSLAPERRTDFAKLGIKCLVAGTIACLMTASVAGIFI